ncbi:MAG: 3TM-type holin [Psychrobacter sp.]
MIAALIPQLLPILGTALDKVIPDGVASEAAKRELEKALVDNANSINLAQLEVNKVEAAHRNVWVSGWRPAIGWSCSLGIGWLFIGHPIATWIAMLTGYNDMVMPTIPTDILLELTFAMLGMAGLRTFEKIKGISK